jgi:hypothetical protein
MFINYLALLSALSVSAVSAYYSIIGLTTIFASQFWAIVIMGSVLEIGKLITASWLYRNWRETPLLIKTYLTTSVIVLMFITSMGIFGFLSKAHIDQSLSINTGSADQIRILNSKIESENKSIEDIDKQIIQIDMAISKMIERGQANSSLRAATQQRKNRDELIKRKDTHVKNISELTIKRIEFESNIRKLEAEVGPIKYIAEMVFANEEKVDLERAVRWVIILLVMVFDPLAVVLLIAANIGLSAKKRFTKEEEIGILNMSNVKI